LRRLAIETAGPAASVALFDGETLVSFVQEATARGTAERLIGMIDQMKPAQIEEILVDVGPGSFTGLRVGLAAAIGLGIGWGVPVRGFGATALVAARALNEGVDAPRLLAVNEGGHRQFFVQSFTTDPLSAEDQPVSSLPEAIPADGHIIVGNAAAKFGGTDTALDARFALHLPVELRALSPVPIYGRAPDARPNL
jgi:tRNA threonylcarbamoyl adenosine modification protein YeaZ